MNAEEGVKRVLVQSWGPATVHLQVPTQVLTTIQAYRHTEDKVPIIRSSPPYRPIGIQKIRCL